jgi:hypothetical protein
LWRVAVGVVVGLLLAQAAAAQEDSARMLDLQRCRSQAELHTRSRLALEARSAQAIRCPEHQAIRRSSLPCSLLAEAVAGQTKHLLLQSQNPEVPEAVQQGLVAADLSMSFSPEPQATRPM